MKKKNCSFATAMPASLLNASYSVFSYGVKRLTGIAVSPPLPPAVSVELSSICNLACRECITGTGLLRRKNEFISYALAEKIAAELRGRTLSAWLYFQGESMMHPRFFDILELFRGMNPVISTNGHFLDGETCVRLASSPLRRIIISYDGVTPEVYNMYRRGGDHARVTEGIRRLSSIISEKGSALKIELQFLLHRGNEKEASAAAAFAASVGADFRIKSMQVLDNERAGEWMPTGSRRSRYLLSQGKWKAAGSPARGCFRMWTTAVITSDGDVLPCCYDKNAGHPMGNLHNQAFRAIWHGEKYGAFRDAVIRSRDETDICRFCPQGRQIFFKSLQP
ncbi:MAG: radical SAM/SPASM domain-containing protein [Bacteroidales bacterium]|nr:radical SAM/SPASM domain-containing protein [Bacteroidales bacterium]